MLLFLGLVFLIVVSLNINAGTISCNPVCSAGSKCYTYSNMTSVCRSYSSTYNTFYDSCIANNKPKYLKSDGSIVDLCTGNDGIVATRDDCGCPVSGQVCQKDGTCLAMCSDRTPVGSCSALRPYECINQNGGGVLVENSGKCGCENGKALSNGECGYTSKRTFSTIDDFNMGTASNMTLDNLNLPWILNPSNADVYPNGFVCGLPKSDGTYSAENNQFIVDKIASLSGDNSNLSDYSNYFNRYCTLEDIDSYYDSPYIEVNFKSTYSINEVTIAIMNLVDYQIQYKDASGNWIVAYNGHQDYSSSVHESGITEKNTAGDWWYKLEGYFYGEYNGDTYTDSSSSQAKENKRYLAKGTPFYSAFPLVYHFIDTSRNDNLYTKTAGVSLFQIMYLNYQDYYNENYYSGSEQISSTTSDYSWKLAKVRIPLGREVAARGIRLIPIQSMPGMKVYEINARNTKDSIKLTSVINNTNGNYGQIYTSNGKYESQVYEIKEANEDLTYESLNWDMNVRAAKVLASNTELRPPFTFYDPYGSFRTDSAGGVYYNPSYMFDGSYSSNQVGSLKNDPTYSVLDKQGHRFLVCNPKNASNISESYVPGVSGTAMNFVGGHCRKGNFLSSADQCEQYLADRAGMVNLGKNLTFSFWMKNNDVFNIGDSGGKVGGIFNGYRLGPQADFRGIWFSVYQDYQGITGEIMGNGKGPMGYRTNFDGQMSRDSGWHHYVITRNWNGTHFLARIYMDNVSWWANDGGGNGGISISDGVMDILPFGEIGRAFFNGGPATPACTPTSDYWLTPYEYLNGSLDEIRVYNKTLTPSEISAIYNLEKNGITPESSMTDRISDKLVSYFTFDVKDAGPKASFSKISFNPGANADRLVIHERGNHIGKIKLIQLPSGWDDSYVVGEWEFNTSKYSGDAVKTIDISPDPSKVPLTWSYMEIYSFDGSNPEIVEIDFLDTRNGANRAIYSPGNLNDVSVGFQIRTSDSIDTIQDKDWMGPNCLRNGMFVSSKGINEPIGACHNGDRYYQYRVIMATNNQIVSPVINNVTLEYTGVPLSSPVAVFTTDGRKVVDKSIQFDGSQSFADGRKIVKYEWIFGDNKTATGVSPSHSYSVEGSYWVILKVTDESGMSAISGGMITVNPFDCVTNEPLGKNNAFNITTDEYSSIVNEMAIQALQEYASKNDIQLSDVNTAEQYMEAALLYLGNHMTYRLVSDTISCYNGFSGTDYLEANVNKVKPTYLFQSLPVTKKYSASCEGKCSGADMCGMCADFSIAYVTLVRAMGVDSRCVYSAGGLNHAANVINYNGKYRIVEPQSGLLPITSNFLSSSLSWSKDYGAELGWGVIPNYLIIDALNDKDPVFSATSVISGGYSSVLNTDLKDKVLNYPYGKTMMPAISTNCKKSFTWKGWDSINSGVKSAYQNSGFDPATLFVDICP